MIKVANIMIPFLLGFITAMALPFTTNPIDLYIGTSCIAIGIPTIMFIRKEYTK